MTEPVTQGDQELHNTVVGTLQAENKQYAHNSSLCKPETEENRLDSQEPIIIKRKRWTYEVPENAEKQNDWEPIEWYVYFREFDKIETDTSKYIIHREYMIPREKAFT